MFCRYCGQQLADNARFCTRCGKSLVAPTPPPPPNQQNNRQTTAPAQPQPLRQEVPPTPPPVSQQAPTPPPVSQQAPTPPVSQQAQTPPLVSQQAQTPPPVSPQGRQPIPPQQPPQYDPQTVRANVENTVNKLREIISQLTDNDIKATSTTGEIRCTTTQAQNAFMKIIRKGKVFVIFLFCFLLSQAASALERTVSTGFGTITYRIEGVEDQFSVLGHQGRTLDQKKTKTKRGYYRDAQNNMQRDELTDLYQLWNGFNSYSVYQNGSVQIVVSFSPSGENSTKKTKYDNIDEVKRYELFYGWSYHQEPKNSTLVRGQVTKPPYQFANPISVVIIDENGCWVRIAARYIHQYIEGKTYREDVEVFYDEFHILPPRPQNNPVEESGGDDLPVIVDPGSEAPTDIGPQHDEIDTVASEDDGEMGWLVPPLIGAIIGAGGLLAWKRKKDKEKKEKEKQKATPPPVPGQKPKKQEEEDPDENCLYEMRIKKNFGDTFVPSDPPQIVYARIVKMYHDGREMTDVGLTKMITITSPDYLEVSDAVYMNGYMAANVFAPDVDGAPTEAVVDFRIAAEGASFTNHMHFFIEGVQFLFGQDNLTLPAGYEKTVELPFVILGLGENPKVELSVEADAYDVELKQDKEKGLWFAVLRENKLCPDFKKQLAAGQYSYYSLLIKAKSESGREEKTEYPICRFQMGLTMDTTYVKCYIEEYDMVNHLSKRFRFEQYVNTTPWNSTDEPKYELKMMTPAETKCQLRLFEYDEEAHRVLRIPAVPDEITFEAVDEARKEIVEKLGIDWEPRKETEDGARPIILRCIRHGLDAPLRVAAKMKVKASFNDRNYELEKNVTLNSQPVRQSKDMADGMNQLKEDERIGENLIHIQSVIFTHGYLKNLAPLDRYIQAMLDGYDATYGYDTEQLRTVRRIWTSFLNGSFAGANAETQPITLGDELMMFFDAFMAKGKEVEDSLGFFSRMALGVFTLGCSEVVFTSMEVVREMKEYVDRGGNSVWGGFWCGVKVVGREYLTEKLMDGGLGLLKKGATKVGLTPENLKAKAKEYYGNITKGRSVKQAIADTKATKARVDMKANQRNAMSGNKQKVSLDDATVKKPALDDATVKKPALDDATVKKPALDDATVKKPGLDDATVKKPALDDATVKKPALDDAATPNKPLQLDYDRHLDLDEIKMKKAEMDGLELGREKIENYRAAIEMLDDSPVNAKLKKDLALEIQKDKNAMSLLADYDNLDLKNTRAKFNKEIASIHESAELKVRQEIAKQYGVPVEDIKTLNASASSKAKLKDGTKITYDHDTTFYYQNPDNPNEVWYFNQKNTEELYNRKYFESANGFEAAEQRFADRFAKSADQTVVQSDFHPESYGTDNFKHLMDPNKKAVKLPDAELVGDAMTYKCKEWYEQGVKELANPSTATSGISKIREACRQCTKQFDNYVNPRNLTRQDYGRPSKIPERFFDYIRIMKDMDVNKGGSVVKAKRELEKLGTSFENVFIELGELMKQIG